MANDRLNMKRIENLSRSGLNREQINLNIDFDTSFKDLQYLRGELSTFLARKENTRDFHRHLDLRIKAVHDLQRIQLQCSFWHKSNWSNEELRAARSSKFLCELIRAVRKIPINKPGGAGAKTGDEGKPSYMVHITEEVAVSKRAAEKKKQQEKRMDFVKPVEAEPSKPAAPADSEQAPDPEAAARGQEEREKKAKEEEKKKAEEEEKKRLEAAAFEQFTDVPLVEEAEVAVAGSEDDEGAVRQRTPYRFISGVETGMRNVNLRLGNDQPFYHPRRVS
jgi:flagellar biosynthesis GTPase FlhF